MATGFIDFTTMDLGAPQGMVTVHGSRPWEIVDENFGRALRNVGGGSHADEVVHFGVDLGGDFEVATKVRYWGSELSCCTYGGLAIWISGGAFIRVYPSNGSQGLQLRVRDNGHGVDVDGEFPRSTGADEWLYIRARAENNELKVRSWAEHEQEPTTWNDAGDISGVPAGFIGLYARNRHTSKAWAFLSWSDNPDANPAPLEPKLFAISGAITDENGNPCQRTVYAMTRPTDGSAPQVLAHGRSDPVTGEYELALPTGNEITRVVVAEDSGNPGPNDPVLPDLVDRVIPG